MPVNIQLGIDATQAEQAFEGFVRKAQARKVTVDFQGNTAQLQAAQVAFAAGAVGSARERADIYRSAAESQPVDSVSRWRYLSQAVQADRQAARENTGFIGGLRAGRFGQLATVGFGLQETGILTQAFAERNREDRLAIADRGGEDSLRRYKAETAIQDRVRSVPIVGNLVSEAVEWATGKGEAARATIEAAQRQERESDRKFKLGMARRDAGDYFREAEGQNYVTLGSGEAEQARRKSQVAKEEALVKAEREHTTAGQATWFPAEIDKRYKALTAGIESAFERTTERINRAETLSVRGIGDERDVMRLRAAGYEQGATLTEMRRAGLRAIAGEEDPVRRRAVQEREAARIEDATSGFARQRSLVADVTTATAQALIRHRSGDVEGELVANQRARRRQALGLLGDLNPNASSINRLSDEQDKTELFDLRRERAFRTRGLEAERDVSGLVADRKPYSAEAEAIFRKGTLSADEAELTSPGDARIMRETLRNQLLGFKNDLQLNGHAVEVPAGSFGPRGVGYGGSGRPDDSGPAVEKADEIITILTNILNANQQYSRFLESFTTDDGT